MVGLFLRFSGCGFEVFGGFTIGQVVGTWGACECIRLQTYRTFFFRLWLPGSWGQRASRAVLERFRRAVSWCV